MEGPLINLRFILTFCGLLCCLSLCACGLTNNGISTTNATDLPRNLVANETGEEHTGVLTDYSNGLGTLTTDSKETLDLDFHHAIPLEDDGSLQVGERITVFLIPGGNTVEGWVLASHCPG